MMFLSHFAHSFQSQVSTVDDRDWEASSDLLVGGLDISFIGTCTYLAFTNSCAPFEIQSHIQGWIYSLQ